jgi:hypothetical protein
MKALWRFAWIALLACIPVTTWAQSTSGSYLYIRSNVNQPWGQSTNEDAMDNTVGAGNWTTAYYETLVPSDVLSSSVSFIFMEGGDSSYAGFENFMQQYGTTLYTWISNGGRLLIMSAPNDPLTSASLYLPDNIVLHSDAFYGSAASSAYATDISNPIFSTPNTTAYSFTGDFFSHGYFTGSQVQRLMSSNLNECVLGQDIIGSGFMVFGGMTTDNFHLPQPAAHSLLENIIYYTAYRSH